jgi:hypothetical protein
VDLLGGDKAEDEAVGLGTPGVAVAVAGAAAPAGSRRAPSELYLELRADQGDVNGFEKGAYDSR